MIEVKDRVPTYPGRVRLTPVSGQANTYDMVRADEPIEEGTPINRALFMSIIDEVASMRKYVNDSIYALSQRRVLGDLPEGTIISLYEHGVLVPFIVLQHNFAYNGQTLVLRKDVYKMDTMLDADDDFYSNSKIDLWLSNEYVSYLDAATQASLTETAFDVAAPDQLGSIDRKAILLSTWEIGVDGNLGRAEGDELSYFTNPTKRIAYFNGSPVRYYTRTIHRATGNNDVEIITETGYAGQEADPVNAMLGIRPALSLPPEMEVTVGVPGA